MRKHYKSLLFLVAALFTKVACADIYGIINLCDTNSNVEVLTPGSYNIKMITYDHSKMMFLYKNNRLATNIDNDLFPDNQITADDKKVSFLVPAMSLVFLETFHRQSPLNNKVTLKIDNDEVKLGAESAIEQGRASDYIYLEKKYTKIKHIGAADFIILKTPKKEGNTDK